MTPFLLLALGATAEPNVVAASADEPEIIVTASLTPVPRGEAPATLTVIDEARIDALGEPFAIDLLRLAPSVSVSQSGPAGTNAQLRIRGAEANHTLLLVDGIRFNDPASGNEARFELLSTDGVRRIELIRGPQSALYGAEAIGGVVSVLTRSAGQGNAFSGTAEGGGKGFRRLSGSASVQADAAGFGWYGGYQEANGIDSFDDRAGNRRERERDGFSNLTFGASGRVGDPARFSVSASTRFTEALSEYDGNDPATFARGDTLDSTRSRIGAGRVAARYGDPADAPFHVEIGATHLGSANRNRLAGDPLNRTSGRRTTVDALASTGFATGAIEHRLIVAGDYERERFVAADIQFGGGTNQRRTRDRGAVVGELRSALGDRVIADVAVRHDSFEGFRDATTVRGAVVARIAGPVSLLASYGTGIARPTFFDQFGFFPGSFIGNPDVRPERSRGGELGLRYDDEALNVGVTAYRQRLRNEIVTVFDADFNASTANVTGVSRRQGVEVDATWRPIPAIGVSATYAYVDAEDRQSADDLLVREVRRPKHSGSLSADAQVGQLSAGASIAYVGARIDNDFSDFPAVRVRLNDYVLGSARLAYRITPAIELFGRVSNLFDADYRDVVGYATQGRTVYGGIRVRVGD
ncbi:MAG: hypothetical protein AVDCRST_MAG91-1155 [uncultured Sphingomonadaceae bacterium]|uniref:Outer membrane vitamin B12 receptor BtuB n=1 Tax=uncultured Sphingomonadaceae bacterium TaxID=169976 RepID=A0A6J4SQS8_9SPHN|nr:MAG: hypothetical protein AVDCRST_MAG91-1155 [uncultured Sphingomonadaceae bacterium]